MLTLLTRLFRKPAPTKTRPIARSLRHLSASARLDLSLKMGYFDSRVYAWGY